MAWYRKYVRYQAITTPRADNLVHQPMMTNATIIIRH